ncbi:TPA: hypothetical protein JWK76_002517 [Escherichia coli]|uniref:hypothetical protein n=1 Tax=Escherichia coli TaxID=562 RepID=UPI0005B61D65|nr:hypothetical protein [Escherichia coli]EES3797474.1 hypothetical protein [Escherichia coli]EFC9842939.1 hypothetical protein [Escherichia coli]EFG2177043.1 hypothetical protein [Escherichia coli]EFJ5712554.1 hypothetical protein [Escherichia coli]EFK1930389.1 hypothetical protein [Escherichia coli]
MVILETESEDRLMLNRLAVIMHGSVTDINLLPVTAVALVERCKRLERERDTLARDRDELVSSIVGSVEALLKQYQQ